ncbi:MAG: hypothetical protein R3F21_13785 [Myxococcota bacterium]
MSLPECLERAASELPELADRIRPANGDPRRLLDLLSPSAKGPADAAGVLARVLAADADAGEELLEAWSELPEAVGVIAAVPENEVPKAGRKLLRRALHRLRAKGVAIETPVTTAPTAPRRLASVSDRWQAAHVSAPDFRGTRMGYLVDDHPAGGARLFEIRFDPARGILDFKLYNAGRSKVRGFLKSLMAGTNQRLFEVEHGALCALVRRASLAQPADRALPTFFVEWRSRLFSEAAAAEPVPGERVRAALEPAEDRAASRERVVADLRAGRIGPWPPATTWVAERMEAAQKRVEGLAGSARNEAIDAFVEETTQALADTTDRSGLAEQLAEWAWIEWKREDREAARALLAVSAELAGAGGAEGNRALARARVDAVFGPFLEALKKDAPKQETLENEGSSER